MATLITDPILEERLLEQRRASGGDKFDEVWDGVYVMSPLADNEHQEIVSGLNTVFQVTITWNGLGVVMPGVNVTDREDDWTRNYRCPDVAVFLKGTSARNRETHWLGGPDFAVEITSPGDRTLDKPPFYGAVGTGELLIVDRDPWTLHLYRLDGKTMIPAGNSTLETPQAIASVVLPLTFALGVGRNKGRPRIEVAHCDGVQRWSI